MKTEAIRYLGERKIELRSMDIPKPGPEEVAVAVEVCDLRLGRPRLQRQVPEVPPLSVLPRGTKGWGAWSRWGKRSR